MSLIERIPSRAPEPLPVLLCPLCGGSRHEPLRRVTSAAGADYELRKCADCELVFLDPRPDAAELTALYDEDFYFSTEWPYGSLASAVIELIQTRRRLRIEHRVGRGRLLDIGSGDGRFVHHMARHGWDATGIEISPAALAFAGRIHSGARFRLGSLEDCDFAPRSLDVVTLWQVLEHIGEPRELLGRCHDLLRRDGLFVASVPNIEGLSSRLTGERWWGLDVPRHLVHYSPATLRGALEGAGFREVRIRHRSLQYDPYALLHSSLDWVFTRRHFLSDLAKRHLPPDMSARECAWDVAALALVGPALAPLSLLATAAAACCRQGGFIEASARRG